MNKVKLHFNVPEDGEWEVPAIKSYILGWIERDCDVGISLDDRDITMCEYSSHDDYRFELLFLVSNTGDFAWMFEDLRRFMISCIECDSESTFMEFEELAL